MSYLLLPGQIKHGTLQAVEAAPLTVHKLAEALRKQGRKFTVEGLRKEHLRELAADHLIELNSEEVSLTIDGYAKLAELNRRSGQGQANLAKAAQNSVLERGIYDGAELKRNVGIPEERFAAFELPSVFMGRRVWPDGRSENLDDLGR